MKYIIFRVLICVLGIADMAWAQVPVEWKLEQKTSGPQGWECPQAVQVIEGSNQSLYLIDEKGVEILRFENLNQGRICARRRNTASPFGTLRCEINEIEQDDDISVFYKATCSSDLPFVKTCKFKDWDQNLHIEKQTLIFTRQTGHSQNQFFQCIYKP